MKQNQEDNKNEVIKSIVPEISEEMKILVIVGPSGVGKDTLMNKILEKYSGKFTKAISYTSRKKRPGEREGYNYHYVTKEAFLKLIEENKMLEYYFYSGNYYGLPKKELEDRNKNDKILYINIGVSATEKIHEINIPANFIAILPPSLEVLEKRLRARKTESEKIIKERLETAKKEIKAINESRLFNFKIYNDNLEETIIDLEGKLKNLYPILNIN